MLKQIFLSAGTALAVVAVTNRTGLPFVHKKMRLSAISTAPLERVTLQRVAEMVEQQIAAEKAARAREKQSQGPGRSSDLIY